MSLSVNFPSVAPSLNLDFAGSERLDPRITFTRATTARYYDGVTTAKAEENLLLQSQAFNDAAWIKTGTSVTANAETAPDGTTTADTATAAATTAVHTVAQSLSTSSLARVISIFAKEGTHSYIQICVLGDATPFANFDLDLGVVGTKDASVTSSITSFGNGWYRCTMEYTSAAATRFECCLVSSDSAVRRESWTAAGTETVYLWGAQLEQRSAVTAYTPTTTQPITNYIPVLLTAAAGVARFDHTPTTGTSLGLLVEEQRTNLLTYSEQFDNAAWAKTNATVTANTIVAPDGTLTGDKLVATSTNGTHSVTIGTVTSGTTYAFSLYAKAGEYSQLQLSGMGVEGQGFNTVYNLATQTVTSAPSGSSITAVGNGWYRCVIIITASATAGPIIRIRNDSGSNSFAGDGFGGIYLWGAQLEAGSFPTSYIPTGVATATRNADVATMTGTNFSSWYNATEGTVYCEYQTVDLASFSSMVAISDGTINNRIQLAHAIALRRYVVTNSGAGQVDMNSGSDTANTPAKTSAAYKVNDFAVSSNGGTVFTDTGGIVPVVDRVFIGATATGTSSFLNGHIRRIAYYPSRLTNEQLVALTR